jgi:hypothetical protein
VGDVGDGDDQAVAAAALLAVDGVVEVAGVLAVDGDQRQAAQVEAADLVLFRHLRVDARRLLLDFGRPHVRDVEVADGDVDLHAGGKVVAEDLDDAAGGDGTVGRVVGDLDRDELAVGRHEVAALHQDLLGQALVVGDHVGLAVLGVVAADHGVQAALDDAHDLAFGTALVVVAGDAREHDVAVEDAAHLARGQQQVGGAVVRDQEAEAVRMAGDAAADEFLLLHRLEGAAAVGLDLAVAHHGAQATGHGLAALVVMQVEVMGQLVGGQRLGAPGEHLENEFPAGNGVFVAVRLAGGMGILPGGIGLVAPRH